jgi:hypothetical protein
LFPTLNFSIGSGIEDAREVERHPFFANIPFHLYEEKKVCLFSFHQIKKSFSSDPTTI